MALEANVKQAVPFFGVSDIEESLRFYVDGLGFELTNQWINKGKLNWCWLQHGTAAIMLQEFWQEGPHSGKPDGTLGQGVTVCFICDNALAVYHRAVAKGLQPKRPFVGNTMWVTSLTDPDGYRIDFESATDVPEETEYTAPSE